MLHAKRGAAAQGVPAAEESDGSASGIATSG